ncbi:hypothetical protein D9M68_384310 [compost metagenome]
MSRRLLLEAQLSATQCALVEQGGGIALVNAISALEYRSNGIVFRPFEPTIAVMIESIKDHRLEIEMRAEPFERNVVRSVGSYCVSDAGNVIEHHRTGPFEKYLVFLET